MSAGSAAVIAKARAKYGGLLGLDEYKTLISKANVGEIVAQLKTYGDFCEDFSAVDNTVRRSQAERLMEKRLFRIYDELRKFCPGSKNKFYDFLLIQEEIKQIINAAMYIGAGVYDLFIPGFPGYLTNICSYDIRALSKSRTFDEILDVLRVRRIMTFLLLFPTEPRHFRLLFLLIMSLQNIFIRRFFPV